MEAVSGDSLHRGPWDHVWTYPSASAIKLQDSFPWIAQFFLPVESGYNGLPLLLFSRRNYYLGPLAAALYLLFVYLGPKIMENRKPFDLRWALTNWNLLLSLFSLWGTVRTVPHLMYTLSTYGVDVSFCTPAAFAFGNGATGLWCALFVYSKFAELLDTAFLVLRKKPVSFLHFYHHITVLLYTWDAFVREQPIGLYFAAMNYLVHTVMYFYYYLAAVRPRPPKWAILVTILQLSQMGIGVVLTVAGLRYSSAYPDITTMTSEEALTPLKVGCAISRINLYGCLFMYATYLVLFAKLFADKYCSKRSTVQSAPRRKHE